MAENDKYTVCTRCFTYNQKQYILDALNGFVMQETSFPVVSVIVDDASTDGEQETILGYFIKNFDTQDHKIAYKEDVDFGTIYYAQHKTNKNCFFAIILLKENHYSQRISKLPYISRWQDNAKYTALCEGDDYWTDPFKLQKQISYMEDNPRCMLCVHSSNWMTGGDLYSGGCQDVISKDFSIHELIQCGGYFFATASFVFISSLNHDWPIWRKEAQVGDYPLQILSGLRGNVHYLPDNMCVYRYQHEGSWSNQLRNGQANISFQKNKIKWMTLLDRDTQHQYQNVIYDQLFVHFNSLYNFKVIGFFEYAKAVYRSGQKRYKRLMKDFLRIELNPLYHFLNRFKKNNNV